jgi:hypothetical protein
MRLQRGIVPRDVAERSQFGGRGFARGRGTGVRGRIGRDGVALEALQLSESAVIGALGGIDAALEPGEGVERAAVDFSERHLSLGALGELVGPELGFDAVEAAQLPIRLDQGVNEKAFQGGGRLELLVISAGECFKLSGIFAGDDLGVGVDAGREGIKAGDGLPLGRAGAGGFLRIHAIRLDL